MGANVYPVSDFWETVRWLHVLAMAFFVGGQLFLAVAVVPVERAAPDRDRLRAIALTLVALVAGLVVWHMRRPAMHALEGAIFIVSLVIVWLGLSLAH
jgi:hypothetical protein